MADTLVWISEADRGDIASMRLNRRKVRRQAIRHANAYREKQRLDQPITFRFLDELKSALPRPAAPLRQESVEEDKEMAADRGRPHVKTNRWAVRSHGSAKERLQKLQELALNLQRITEGGYAAARIQYSFDLLDLSTFASAHMGRAAADSFHEQETARQGVLRVRETSYLDFVPQLYTENHLLRLVVDSVLAQAQKTLCHDAQISDADIYVLYGKAIQELQGALNNEDTMRDPMVLCSVQLMQLFEALNSNHLTHWSKHSSGISRLIQIRGAERCTNDFERALLYSQLGTIFGESLRDGIDCFLGEPAWQEAFCDFIKTETLAHRRTEIKLWSIEVLIPKFMRQADDFILSSTCEDVEDIDLFIERLKRWKELSFHLQREAIPSAEGIENVKFRMLENLALAWGADMLVNRAIVALDPLAVDAAAIEAATMDLAERIFATARQCQANAPRGGLLISRAMLVANMAVKTRELFTSAITGDPACLQAGTGKIAEAIWRRNCELIGRRPRFASTAG